MASEIKVPDIGDFDAVEIIEILVSEGQQVSAEDPLIALESDKATMEIPAPADGTIVKLLVKVGQMVAEGTPIASFNAAEKAEGKEPDDAATADSTTAKSQPNQHWRHLTPRPRKKLSRPLARRMSAPHRRLCRQRWPALMRHFRTPAPAFVALPGNSARNFRKFPAADPREESSSRMSNSGSSNA